MGCLHSFYRYTETPLKKAEIATVYIVQLALEARSGKLFLHLNWSVERWD